MAGTYVRDVNGAVRQAPQRPLRIDSKPKPSKHDSFSSEDDSDEEDSATQAGRRSYMPPVHAAASSNTVPYRGGPSLQVACALRLARLCLPLLLSTRCVVTRSLSPAAFLGVSSSAAQERVGKLRECHRQRTNARQTCPAPPGRTTCWPSSAFRQPTSGRWRNEALLECWQKWARR